MISPTGWRATFPSCSCAPTSPPDRFLEGRHEPISGAPSGAPTGAWCSRSASTSSTESPAAALAAVAVPQTAGREHPAASPKQGAASQQPAAGDRVPEAPVGRAGAGSPDVGGRGGLARRWHWRRVLRPSRPVCSASGHSRSRNGRRSATVESRSGLTASEWADSDDPCKANTSSPSCCAARSGRRSETWWTTTGGTSSSTSVPRAISREVRLPTGRRVVSVPTTSETAGSATTATSGSAAGSSASTALVSRDQPEYRFTRDGHVVSKFHAENNAKIKRIERNDAVRQQIRALATFLHRPETLLTPDYRFLGFGRRSASRCRSGSMRAHGESRPGRREDDMHPVRRRMKLA